MSSLEYRSAIEARGGLLTIGGVDRVAFGDRVEVRDGGGRLRTGQVIRTAPDEVLLQVFEGTDALDLETTWVRFLDEPLEMSLSPDILGRVFNGLGEPRDDRPPILNGIRRPVAGSAINPSARTYPSEFIQTGISTIDGLNSLVRGQKLPIFSASGLPHNRLAAQIVRQGRVLRGCPVLSRGPGRQRGAGQGGHVRQSRRRTAANWTSLQGLSMCSIG